MRTCAIQVAHEECNWQLWPVGGDEPKSVKLTLVKAEASFWKTLLKDDDEKPPSDAIMHKKKDD